MHRKRISKINSLLEENKVFMHLSEGCLKVPVQAQKSPYYSESISSRVPNPSTFLLPRCGWGMRRTRPLASMNQVRPPEHTIVTSKQPHLHPFASTIYKRISVQSSQNCRAVSDYQLLSRSQGNHRQAERPLRRSQKATTITKTVSISSQPPHTHNVESTRYRCRL